MSTIANPYISKQDLHLYRLERYRYNLLLSGKQKDREWLTEKIMSGRVLYPFFTGDEDDAPEWKQLTSEATKRMYAESLIGYLDKIGEQYEWDMHVEVVRYRISRDRPQRKIMLKMCPVIRFREFTIENSNGAERDLKELFIFFHLQVTCVKDGKMVLRPTIPEGMRTLFHEDEYNSGYVHSHLYSLSSGSREQDAKQTKQFCIGSDQQEELIALLGGNYDPHLFASFLMILRTMAEWESLEGVPYLYIESNITSRAVRPETAPSHDAVYIRQSMHPIYLELPALAEKIDFNIHQNHYSVRMTREFEDALKDLLVRQGYTNFLAKRIGGRWVKYDAEAARNLIEDPHDDVFIFGGEELKLSTYNDEGIEENDDENRDDINTYRIYPKFLDYVKLQINAKLYHNQVSGSFAEAES